MKTLVYFCWLALSLPVVAGNFFQGVSPSHLPVQGGIVRYQFDTNLSVAEQQTYLYGLREWELAANVHFVAHTNTDTNWILFKYAAGTSVDTYDLSSVPWTVTISVLSRSQICHEMGHVFGFAHENIRVDKTNYITVLTNNVTPPANIAYFNVDPTTQTNGAYDYESVMHLGNNFSSYDQSVYTQLANHPYERYQQRMGNWAISAGDRAALAYLYGAPATALTNVVTTTLDYGFGSLRAAMYYGVDHPGSTIRFNIPTNDSGYSNGVYNIHLTAFLPPLVANGTIIDGSTQPGFTNRPLIFIDGSQMLTEAYPLHTTTGLLMYVGNCQLKSLAFENFNWNGITLTIFTATNNTISGCWSGLDYTGTNAAPNGDQGILIYNGASGNIVGGTNAATRNVLSGNTGYGVYITGTNVSGNVARWNYIGSDYTGMLAVPNQTGGSIVTVGSYSNVIGPGNVISGNTSFGLWIDSSNNTVQGNWLGLNAVGNAALPNTFVGAYIIYGAQNNLIVSNVFSGNYSEGLRFAGAGTTGNTAQGNFFGTDATGSNAVPNGFAGLTFYGSASGNVVGGLTAAARNVMSGNSSYGVALGDSGTVGNIIEGNYIGLSTSGTAAVGNFSGVDIAGGASSNQIGPNNTISGNIGQGIEFDNTNTTGNLVTGNNIGLAANGATPLGNGWEGIVFQSGASSNFIGGNVSTLYASNSIACNGFNGINVYDSNAVGNTFRGNCIYSNGYLGINLNGGTEDFYGVTANDLGDSDIGANRLQNYPVLSNAVVSGGNLTISGSLNSLANHSYSIDFYRNLAADGSGHGEGQFYLGTVGATTSAGGNTGFSFSIAGNIAGQYISATATDSASGDTSEFSTALPATNGPSLPSFTGIPNYAVSGFTVNISVTSGQSYHVQSSTNLALGQSSWTNLTNFTASGTNFSFLDHSATNSAARFYRVISP